MRFSRQNQNSASWRAKQFRMSEKSANLYVNSWQSKKLRCNDVTLRPLKNRMVWLKEKKGWNLNVSLQTWSYELILIKNFTTLLFFFFFLFFFFVELKNCANIHFKKRRNGYIALQKKKKEIAYQKNFIQIYNIKILYIFTLHCYKIIIK